MVARDIRDAHGAALPAAALGRFDMAAALDAVVEASADGRRPTLPTAADGLADEVTLMGTYGDAGDAIAAWFRAGA